MISGMCSKSENWVNAALNGFGGHSLLFIATICEHATGSCVVLSIGGLLVFSWQVQCLVLVLECWCSALRDVWFPSSSPWMYWTFYKGYNVNNWFMLNIGTYSAPHNYEIEELRDGNTLCLEPFLSGPKALSSAIWAEACSVTWEHAEGARSATNKTLGLWLVQHAQCFGAYWLDWRLGGCWTPVRLSLLTWQCGFGAATRSAQNHSNCHLGSSSLLGEGPTWSSRPNHWFGISRAPQGLAHEYIFNHFWCFFCFF